MLNRHAAEGRVMNGAESLVRTLVAGGVDVCFANPGTSEMHFVAALDRVEGMRCVLALFEGVVTGAADGYARMAGKPAATLLHLGPGLANGLANLHNAGKAATPVVNIIGDHATYHRGYDAPLTSDIEGAARPFCGWVRTSPDARSVAKDGAEAIAAAMTPPGKVTALIVLSQVILSFQLPFAMIPLIQFTGDRAKMGTLVNSRVTKGVAWVVAGVILFFNGELLWFIFRG